MGEIKMKIKELIKKSELNVVEASINNYMKSAYLINANPTVYTPLVSAIELNLNAENECVTDSISSAAQIIGDLYFQYTAAKQDFNIDTKRDTLLQSINKITANSKLTNTNKTSTTEAADSTTQAYVQNQSQESDSEWNNNKFRDSATQNDVNSTASSDSAADSNQTSDTTQTTNPALIRFTRELRNLNVFAAKLWQNFIRTCVFNLSQPFEVEASPNRNLPPFFTYE